MKKVVTFYFLGETTDRQQTDNRQARKNSLLDLYKEINEF